MGMVIVVVVVVVDNKMFDTIIIIIHNRNHESWYILIYSVFLPVESTWDKIYCKMCDVDVCMPIYIGIIQIDIIIIKEKV